MKVVINTQVRENYAAHNGFTGEYYWKYKGGNAFVVHNVTIEQNMSAEWWDDLYAAIQFSNDSFEEYVISADVVDDIDYDESAVCEKWESPVNLHWVQGAWVASRITRPDEYETWSNDIVEKRETWTQCGGENKDYVLRYVKSDGSITNWKGEVLEAA